MSSSSPSKLETSGSGCQLNPQLSVAKEKLQQPNSVTGNYALNRLTLRIFRTTCFEEKHSQYNKVKKMGASCEPDATYGFSQPVSHISTQQCSH